MTDRELMQMAFKAMDSVNEFSSNSIYAGIFDWEVKILRDRLAQPEQPDFSKAGFGKPQNEEGCAGCGKKASKGWALYCVKCSEPVREWQALTNEEIKRWKPVCAHFESFRAGIRAIEAKLSADGRKYITTEPQIDKREWQGLTDEQVDGYWDESVSTGCRLSFGMGVDYANRVLKEKNT